MARLPPLSALNIVEMEYSAGVIMAHKTGGLNIRSLPCSERITGCSRISHWSSVCVCQRKCLKLTVFYSLKTDIFSHRKNQIASQPQWPHSQQHHFMHRQIRRRPNRKLNTSIDYNVIQFKRNNTRMDST